MNKRSMDSMLGKDLGAAEQAIRDAADDLDARLHARAREIAGRAQSAYDQIKDQGAAAFSGADALCLGGHRHRRRRPAGLRARPGPAQGDRDPPGPRASGPLKKPADLAVRGPDRSAEQAA